MKEYPLKTGRCFECGANCTGEEWCWGCDEFVCDNCDLANDTPIGDHNPEDHLEEDEDDAL